VVRKFFPLDKNYLLEHVQLRQEAALLAELIAIAQHHYQERYNPLGLTEPRSEQVRTYAPGDLSRLHPFYRNLAAVYRFKFGHNQLAFLWDGTDHTDYYRAEWTAFFLRSCTRLCGQELFLRAVLDLTVFFQEDAGARMAESRMHHFLTQTFDLRILKKGIVPARVA
jgi:hypothetical protein